MNHFVHAMYREGERECMVTYSQGGGGGGQGKERVFMHTYLMNGP